jgi:hypothetical protein
MFRPKRCSSLAASLSLLALTALGLLTGCGGGVLSSSGPVIGTPVITTVPTPLTNAGGTATVSVQITGDSLLNVNGNPPRIDVKDTLGVSLLGGPQPMTSLNSDPNAWVFQFNVPTNTTTSPIVYRATVFAQSISGATGNTPFFAGAITLPGH